MNFIAVNGVAPAPASLTGSGDAARSVLIHEMAEHVEKLDEVVPRLAAAKPCRVLRYDTRGAGCRRRSGALSIDTMVDDLAR
jgi:alpha-beta hydrolase superfamily lysophospholipase